VNVEFVGSYPDLKSRPERELPEFAFLGRSNCGKSSLLNYLMERKGLARTSGKPGKTRLLNYFLVEDRFYLVDLPGYGYAKVSKVMRKQWWGLFERYLLSQDRPKAILHLLDSRHAPSQQDKEMSALVQKSGDPFAIVATKIDKVLQRERMENYRRIIMDLDLSANIPFLPTSAAKKHGREDILSWMEALLAGADQDV